jgi:hypothetical protein
VFGIRSAPPPGIAAVRALCLGWDGFSPEEKQALAEILVKVAPGLAAQGDRASALPLAKIQAALGAAFRAAWTGILQPRKLLEQIGAALETDPAAAELRAFCVAVGERCRREAEAKAAREAAQTPPLGVPTLAPTPPGGAP